MVNLITGLIGVLMITVFLGHLSITLGSIPLLIITAIILAMVFTDFVQSVRKGGDKTGE